VQCFGRGFAWLATGAIDSLMEASAFIEAIQKRQGLLVAALEEIAYRKGFITADRLRELAAPLITTHYGQYLDKLANGQIR
ncbi:MAG: glucose-1-phosphate thymidylyltransferase, partial [Muribaculaceae bacterium]|nr:glucose-1-phosphate thymidylyltransferase [Muribaculaceae bacterium]